MQQIPFSPSMPHFTENNALAFYSSNEFSAFLMKDVPSWSAFQGNAALIKYPWIMVLFENQTQIPVYILTLESGITGSIFLCAFANDGSHLNFGPVDDTYSVQEFVKFSIQHVAETFAVNLNEIPDPKNNQNQLAESKSNKFGLGSLLRNLFK